jgi:hypothetical protein
VGSGATRFSLSPDAAVGTRYTIHTLCNNRILILKKLVKFGIVSMENHELSSDRSVMIELAAATNCHGRNFELYTEKIRY